MILTHAPFQTKLLFGFLVTTLFALLVISGASFYSAREQLRMITFERLTAARETKKAEIEKTFRDIASQCLTFSESYMIFDAMESLKAGFFPMDITETEFEVYKKELATFYEQEFLPKINATSATKKNLNDVFPQDRKTIIFQTKYIARNPNTLISKHEYNSTGDNTPYDQSHSMYHTIYTKYINRFGYSDIYFVDIDTGYVIFNISKTIDYATNLLTGPFKDTPLADAFRECQKTADENFVTITDFAFYDPLYGKPTAFIGTPIFSQGKKLGVLIVQLPVNTINTIMTYDKRWVDAGLGVTGEVYLRGNDKLMRSLSRFFIEDRTQYINQLQNIKINREIIDKINIYNTTILLQRAGEALDKLIDGSSSGVLIGKDYLGTDTLFAYAPLAIKGLEWVIVAKISSNEAFAPIHMLAQRAIIWSLVVLILVFIFSFVVVRKTTAKLMLTVQEMAEHTKYPTKSITHVVGGHVGVITTAYNSAIALINKLITAIHEAISQTHPRLTTLNTHTAISLQTLQTMRESLNLASNTIRTIQEHSTHLQLISTQVDSHLQTASEETAHLQESDTLLRKMLDEVYLYINHALGSYAQARSSMQDLEKLAIQSAQHDTAKSIELTQNNIESSGAFHREILQKLYDQLMGIEQRINTNAQTIPLRLERQKELLSAVQKIHQTESQRTTLQKNIVRSIDELSSTVQGMNTHVEHNRQQIQDMQNILDTLAQQETELKNIINRIPTT